MSRLGVCIALFSVSVGSQLPQTLQRLFDPPSPCVYMHDGHPNGTAVVCADYTGQRTREIVADPATFPRVPSPAIVLEAKEGDEVHYAMRMRYRPATEYDRKLSNLLITIRYRRDVLRYLRHSVDKGLVDEMVYDGNLADPSKGLVILLVDPSVLRFDSTMDATASFVALKPLARNERDIASPFLGSGYLVASDTYGAVEVFPKDAKTDWYLPATQPDGRGSFAKLVLTQLLSRPEMFGQPFGLLAGYTEAFRQGQRVQFPPMYVVPASTRQTTSLRARVAVATVPRQVESGSTFSLRFDPRIEGAIKGATLNVELSEGLTYLNSGSQGNALNPGRYPRGTSARSRRGQTVQTSGDVLEFRFGRDVPKSIDIAVRADLEGTQSISWSLLAQGPAGETVNSEEHFTSSQTNSLGWGVARTLVAVLPAPPRPALLISARSLSFVAPEGGSARASALISNQGNADLRVKIASNDPAFSLEGSSEVVVAPGSSELVWFAFRPRGTRAVTAVARLRHNDADAPPSEIGLAGTVRALPRGDGRIEGQVKDAHSNKGLGGATVTATNLETGDRYSVQASRDGEYRIDKLPASSYGLRVERPGFVNTGFDSVPLQQLPRHRADDLVHSTRPGNQTEIASFSTFWQQLQEARAEARARRAEMWGNILGVAAVGVISGLTRNPPPPDILGEPAAPPPVQGVGGPVCDVLLEFRALFANRPPVVRSFVRPPGFSPTDADINAFVQTFQQGRGLENWASQVDRGRYERFSELPSMPGIPRVLWDGHVRTLDDFGDAAEREEKAGGQPIGMELRTCGFLFLATRVQGNTTHITGCIPNRGCYTVSVRDPK